jgi:hypothetical protein
MDNFFEDCNIFIYGCIGNGLDFRIADSKSKRNFGLGHRLVQIVGADSISAPEQGRYGICPYLIRGRKDDQGRNFY